MLTAVAAVLIVAVAATEALVSPGACPMNLTLPSAPKETTEKTVHREMLVILASSYLKEARGDCFVRIVDELPGQPMQFVELWRLGDGFVNASGSIQPIAGKPGYFSLGVDGMPDDGQPRIIGAVVDSTDDFSVVWMCSNLQNAHIESALVLSTKPMPEGASALSAKAKPLASKALKDAGAQVEDLADVRQGPPDCPMFDGSSATPAPKRR